MVNVWSLFSKKKKKYEKLYDENVPLNYARMYQIENEEKNLKTPKFISFFLSPVGIFTDTLLCVTSTECTMMEM